MKNSQYWQLRFTQLEQAQNKMAAESSKEIEQHYKQAQKEIEAKINTWYQRFAKNNGITMAEARQFLKNADLTEFKWDVQDYIKYGQDNALMGGWTKELENASAKFHISRLEALKIQTQQSLEAMFTKQLGIVSATMQSVYESGYFHTAFELQKGFGVGWDIAGLNQSAIEKVISKPWTVDGKNFSERIWGNKQKLISEIHSDLTQNIMLGADPQKAINSIAKKMNTSKTNAGKLVMTEEAYFSSAAQKDCFEELDVEEYEIVATLDSHTSEICRNLDGQHFPMKDFQPGVTAPPFHVWCRTTTAPYFNENFGSIGERAARDEETGKTYYIPDDMNYKEWKKTFVDGGDKLGFDIFDDGSTLHYKKHIEPTPEPPPKKEYLTKKKLQAKIALADVQLEGLEKQFQDQTGGVISYEDFKKDYSGDYSAISYDAKEEAALKSLVEQMEAVEAQKAEWQAKLDEKLKAEQKKVLVKQQLDLEAQKAAIQQQLDDFEVKTYSDIWKEDKTTADWGSLNIEGKKQYYESKFITETDPDLLQKYKDLYKQLEELDTEGGNYYNIQQQLKKIETEISKVQSDLTNLEKGVIVKDNTLEAFTQERKDAAYWFTDKNGGVRGADSVLRSKAGEVWRNATEFEKDSIYNYTSSFHKFNEPLRGIEYGTEKFLGVGNVDLDQIGVKTHGWEQGAIRKEIDAVTSIIEKSSYDFDIWVQRGCGFKGMDKFLNIDMYELMNATEAELQKLINTTPIEYAFMSTGVAKGKGLNVTGEGITFNIYAPKGTKMMYIEPISAFGNGVGRSWDGVSQQNYFGNEAEMLFQRGTSFVITKVEKKGNRLYIDMDVTGQITQP